MRFIKYYIHFINQLNETVGKTVSWLTTALVLLICFDVVRRYAFKTTTVAFIELEWYIFSMIFLLGAGYSLKHDQHVRVDVFYGRFSEKGKAWVDLVGGIFFLLPFCVVVMYAGFQFTAYSFRLDENSPNPGGLPATYLIKAMIPLGFLFLFLQTTAFICKAWLTILSIEISNHQKGEN